MAWVRTGRGGCAVLASLLVCAAAALVATAAWAQASTGTSPAAAQVSADTGHRNSAAAVAIAAAVLLASIVGLIVVLIRRSMRSEQATAQGWDEAIGRSLATARWFCDRVAGDVADRSETATVAARLWADSEPIVVDLERSLVDAVQSAPDAVRVERAERLARAVRALRDALRADLRVRGPRGRSDDQDAAPSTVEHVVEARRRLDVLLAQPPVTRAADPS